MSEKLLLASETNFLSKVKKPILGREPSINKFVLYLKTDTNKTQHFIKKYFKNYNYYL
jgi:hypothetical protein